MNRIILKKRKEMMDMINKFYEKDELYDALDIGTTNDMEYYHSNFLIKNLKNKKVINQFQIKRLILIFLFINLSMFLKFRYHHVYH